mmetsp:Transcript_5107/g.19176  ORF Transcript_5107/g.19176 Transcript_5107/m.19176 type:complete len:446 (-) Transcript_5107:491-1828(-)
MTSFSNHSVVVESTKKKSISKPPQDNEPLLMVFDSKTLERRSPTRRKPKNLSRDDFENVLHLPQKEASAKLDVCISTLKRQFRKLFPQRRWPTPSERKVTHKSHKSKVLRRRLRHLVDVNEDFLTGQSTGLQLESDEEFLQQIDNKMDVNDESSSSPPALNSTSSSTTILSPYSAAHQTSSDFQLYPTSGKYLTRSSSSSLQQQLLHPSHIQGASENPHNSDYHFALLARLLQDNFSLHTSIKKQRLFAQSLHSQLKVPQVQLPSSQFQGDIFDIPGPWDTHPDVKDQSTALFLVDEWLNLVAISQGLCRMTGYTFMDLAPTTHYAIFVSRLFRPEYFAILAQRVLESELTEIVFTDTFVRKDKSLFRVTQYIHKIGKRFFWAIVKPTDTKSSSFLKINHKEAYSNAVEYTSELSEAEAAAEHMSAIRGISEQVALNPSVGAYQE